MLHEAHSCPMESKVFLLCRDYSCSKPSKRVARCRRSRKVNGASLHLIRHLTCHLTCCLSVGVAITDPILHVACCLSELEQRKKDLQELKEASRCREEDLKARLSQVHVHIELHSGAMSRRNHLCSHWHLKLCDTMNS